MPGIGGRGPGVIPGIGGRGAVTPPGRLEMMREPALGAASLEMSVADGTGGPGTTDGAAGVEGDPPATETSEPAGKMAGASTTTSGTETTGAEPASFSTLADFLVGFGSSSGCTSRLRPSRSALRRARSACASSMLEEWLLTPIPSPTHRSSVSLLVSPSSLASSWSLILAAKLKCSFGSMKVLQVLRMLQVLRIAVLHVA